MSNWQYASDNKMTDFSVLIFVKKRELEQKNVLKQSDSATSEEWSFEAGNG